MIQPCTRRECVAWVQDEEFARKTAASLPPRILSKQLKVLVTGQPETGRTTTIRNLFASIAQDPTWSPVDTENLTMEDFRANPAAFTTVIEDCPDVSGRLSMSYIIQARRAPCPAPVTFCTRTAGAAAPICVP